MEKTQFTYLVALMQPDSGRHEDPPCLPLNQFVHAWTAAQIAHAPLAAALQVSSCSGNGPERSRFHLYFP